MSDDKISLHLDPDLLTLGDLEDFEDTVGRPVDEVLAPRLILDEDGNKTFDERGRPITGVRIPAKALVCLVWLVNRKDNPAFTLADARKVRVDQLEIPATDESDQGNA